MPDHANSSLIAHLQLLAQYNALANQTLYSACAKLDDVMLTMREMFTAIRCGY